jgi:hypothetical protein
MNKLVHCETNCETNCEEIGNKTDATMVDLHIHRPTGLRRNLQRLCSVFGLEKDDKNTLRSMFSSTSVFVPVYDREFQCDIAFSFWGFVKNDETRTRLLEFLFWCLQPKTYMAGETLAGKFIEGFMIVSLDRLHIGRDAFGKWLDKFFDIMKMSAGTIIFTEHLGEQMLTSMNRIQGSNKLRTNIYTDWNRNFLKLYTLVSKIKTEQQRVMSVTGMPFTAENFVDVVMQNRSNEMHRTLQRESREEIQTFPRTISQGWEVRPGIVRQIMSRTSSGHPERRQHLQSNELLIDESVTYEQIITR